MEVQEKTQADFDIERMFDMLDTALTSRDERVQSALRALLTIIALTKPQEDGRSAVEDSNGPLRQMQEDLKDLNRRVYNLQNEIRQMKEYPKVPTNPWVQPGAAPIGSPYTNPGSPYGPTWTGQNPTTWSVNTTPWPGVFDEKVEK